MCQASRVHCWRNGDNKGRSRWRAKVGGEGGETDASPVAPRQPPRPAPPHPQTRTNPRHSLRESPARIHILVTFSIVSFVIIISWFHYSHLCSYTLFNMTWNSFLSVDIYVSLGNVIISYLEIWELMHVCPSLVLPDMDLEHQDFMMPVYITYSCPPRQAPHTTTSEPQSCYIDTFLRDVLHCVSRHFDLLDWIPPILLFIAFVIYHHYYFYYCYYYH